MKFTIKVSTIIWGCVILFVVLVAIGFVGLTLYQGTLMK